MNNDERKAIWYVLEDLLNGGEKWLQKGRAEGEPALAVPLKPINRHRLQTRFLHHDGGEFGPDEIIQVKPPLREVRLAALRCKWHFGGKAARCWFHLGIWLKDGQFIGFRFEPPEQGDNHNYYHSQPCRTMGDGKPITRALELPERNPTWPLPATSPLELLLCLVLSIHGMTGLRKMVGRNPNRYRVVSRAIECVTKRSGALLAG